MQTLHTRPAHATWGLQSRRPSICTRQPIRTNALPSLSSFLSTITSKQKPGVKQQRDELLEYLVSGKGDSKRISQLVDELAAAEVPFKEELLGGGPWVVRYSKGALQLWRATYSPGKLINSSNRASQDLQPRGRSVLNKAEYAGSSLYVTASGNYSPQDSSRSCPKAIDVHITSGAVHIGGRQLALPIRGRGQFRVLYLDRELRIFESLGSYAVQVRVDRLAAAGEA